MKKYEELTTEQQEKARNKALTNLLETILDGGIRFDDDSNQNDLQARIDRACEKAEKMRTPWFAHEHIMDTCGDELEGMAQRDAEDSLYAEQDDPPVVFGIA